jgi:hypothetical protein
MKIDPSRFGPLETAFIVAIAIWAAVDSLLTVRGLNDPECATGWKLTKKYAPRWWKWFSLWFWAAVLIGGLLAYLRR